MLGYIDIFGHSNNNNMEFQSLVNTIQTTQLVEINKYTKTNINLDNCSEFSGISSVQQQWQYY